MLFFILGSFFGVLLMFCARLADKDLTRIVEHYGKTGSLRSAGAKIILPPEEKKTLEQVGKEFMDQMNSV